MTLRVGILGAARVAVYAMIGAAKQVEGVQVTGIAARDPDRARSYADEHGIPTVFDTYKDLIASPDIDAVYVALPPNLHARWSIAALEAGKPVLCEKPFALEVADVEAMLAAEARSGTLLMEAQHTHYHPIGARMREIVQSGVIGKVRHIAAHFSTEVARTPTELRWQPDVGGGGIWDLGVYPAYWVRSIMAEEPELVAAHQWLADTDADIRTVATLAFPSGATGEITSDMATPFAAWVMVEGSVSTMRVENPLLAPLGQSITITRGDSEVTETFTNRASFAFQLEAFRDAILTGGSVPTRGEDSLATISLLARIRDTSTKER